MPIDPIKIPQNVHIEDRIIGPLTLRQIIITAIGCGFSYALYAALSKAYGSVSIPITVLVWIPGVLSAIFAFVRFNDLSMLRLILLTAERMTKPSTRTWSPRRGIAINIRTFAPAEEEKNKKEHRAKTAAKERENLHELSTVLDQPLPSGEQPEDPLVPPQEQRTKTHARPVDPSRVQASPLRVDEPMGEATPQKGSVSVFRDLSPRSS